MKSFFRLALICIVFCTAGYTQVSAPSGIVWVSLQPEGEIFSVELPSTISSDRSHDKSQSKYWTSINGDYFMIFSEKSETPGNIRIALEYIRSHQKQAEKRRVGLVETERFDFVDEDGFYHSAISFGSGEKMYLFHGISRTSDDTLVKRFFSSLKLNGLQAEQPTTESTEEIVLPPKVNLAPQATSPTVSGYGSGISGQGSGNGSGNSGRTVSPPEALPPTTPLKMVSKPRAAYTDLARIYEIQGVVRLKVTLLSTGEVGSVSPITYLPFGLMGTAIEAARKIQFEPRRVNGVPISSIVTMEYGFSIY